MLRNKKQKQTHKNTQPPPIPIPTPPRQHPGLLRPIPPPRPVAAQKLCLDVARQHIRRRARHPLLLHSAELELRISRAPQRRFRKLGRAHLVVGAVGEHGNRELDVERLVLEAPRQQRTAAGCVVHQQRVGARRAVPLSPSGRLGQHGPRQRDCGRAWERW
jgi:hypothetical protein